MIVLDVFKYYAMGDNRMWALKKRGGEMSYNGFAAMRSHKVGLDEAVAKSHSR